MIKLTYDDNGRAVIIAIEAGNDALEEHLIELITKVVAEDSFKRQLINGE